MVELLGVFGVVVVELPPDETFETESDTGNVAFCKIQCQSIFIELYLTQLIQNITF